MDKASLNKGSFSVTSFQPEGKENEVNNNLISTVANHPQGVIKSSINPRPYSGLS